MKELQTKTKYCIELSTNRLENENKIKQTETSIKNFLKSLAREKKNLKQSWLPTFWKKIQNTRDYKNAF